VGLTNVHHLLQNWLMRVMIPMLKILLNIRSLMFFQLRILVRMHDLHTVMDGLHVKKESVCIMHTPT
jgi:hypothetical protein